MHNVSYIQRCEVTFGSSSPPTIGSYTWERNGQIISTDTRWSSDRMNINSKGLNALISLRSTLTIRNLPIFNFVFPYFKDIESNSTFVFLGEVIFLDGLDSPPCPSPEQITMRVPPIG